ncbi:MAG TPA: hypothetical protein VF541_17480, partial [Longimicrobium sp.]
MSDGVRELVRRLGDRDGWQAARERLLALGPAAAGELAAALGDPGLEPAARHEALRILVEMKAPESAEAFRAALRSADETERALGAAGLRALETDDAVEATLHTLDDAPDSLHFEVTPSAAALGQMGLAGVRAALPLLSSPEPRTRQHAQT